MPIFVTSDSGFKEVEEAYSLFSWASAARLNTQKSQGLWAGSWIGRNDKPLHFSWNSEGLPFLGVHLGNTNNYVKRNWQKCKDKLNKTLSSWSRLSASLSFKGKIIIANQLAASKIFHGLAVLSPPENVLSELQNILVDFVWSNKRLYLKKQVPFQKPDRGGLGLACLQARIFTFRFTTIQRFLNLCSHPAYFLVSHFLKQYRKLGFDYQLFLLKTDSKCYTSLPVYYSEILRAWTASGARIKTQPDSINHVFNLPLNGQFASFTADGDQPPLARLTACGIKLIRYFLDFNTGRWIDPRTFNASLQGFRPPSLRLLQYDLRRQHLTLTQNFPLIFHEEGCRLSSSQLQNISFRPDSPVIFKLSLNENGLSHHPKICT